MSEPPPTVDAPSLSRRVAAGAGWAQASRLAEVVSSLVLSLLLIRALGPGRYGEYAFLLNVAVIGAVLLSLGFPESVMRFVSVLLARDEVPQIRFLMRRLVLTRALVYSVGIALFFALRGAGVWHRLPLIETNGPAIVLLLVGQGAVEFATSYAYARLRSRDVALARTVGQAIAVLFFVSVVVLNLTDVFTAALTTALAYLSATFLLWFRGLGEVIVTGRSAPMPLRPVAGFAVGVWATTLCTIGLAGQIDVLLLGALRHDAVQIALYSVATLVFVKLGTFLAGWAGTATSSFADVHTRRGPEASRRLLGFYMRFQVLLSLVVYPPVILLSGQIASRVFGPGYASAARLMMVYGGFWLVSSLLAAGIPLSVLLALGYQRQALAIRAGTGLLNVILDIALIPPLGALGAVLATGIANVLAHFSDFAVTSRALKASYPWTYTLKLIVAAAVAFTPGLLISSSGLLGSLAAAALYGVLFGAGLLILRPVTPADIELVSRLSPRAAAVVQLLAGQRPGDPDKSA